MKSKAKIKPKYLVAIDIGNTTTHIGVFSGRKLLKEYRVEKGSVPRIAQIIRKSGGKSYKDVLFCSVVPQISRKLRKVCGHIRTVNRMYEIGREVRLVINHKYNRIRKLGNDRLVNIFGAMIKYDCPCVVIDFGTAITVDYISRESVFEGGLIIPGIRTSLDALSNRAALLPKVRRLHKRRGFIGRNTKEGMIAGILEGYACMINGLIRSFRKRYGKRVKAIATGGMLTLLSKKTYEIDCVDPTLTLKALSLIHSNFLSS